MPLRRRFSTWAAVVVVAAALLSTAASNDHDMSLQVSPRLPARTCLWMASRPQLDSVR